MSDPHPGPTLGNVFPSPLDSQSSSFAAVLRRAVPDAVPALLNAGATPLQDQFVEGTTVLAMLFEHGVVVAGDRRATAGNWISRSDMRKVFPADHHSAIAISGAAGPAMGLARVFSTELEHYEKVEGEGLSLEGKSNKLAGMVRGNLSLAMQGLVVVPLFAGVDPRSGEPGIFEYDSIGGRYEARKHAASGSGSLIATQAMKTGFRTGMAETRAIAVCLSALYDAAEQDAATGGPDIVREITPIVAVIDQDGYRELSTADVTAHVEEIIQDRRSRE